MRSLFACFIASVIELFVVMKANNVFIAPLKVHLRRKQQECVGKSTSAFQMISKVQAIFIHLSELVI